MKNHIFFTLLILFSCNAKEPSPKDIFLVSQTPKNVPLAFQGSLAPANSIIHRGIFSNDLAQYYITVSDTLYSNFKVLVSHKENGKWSQPTEAFFNSEYSEHGMSFSPDGKTLVFSSTRPVPREGVPDTWHIWMSQKQNNQWINPKYVKIPGLESKLLSHPSLAPDGTLYFHASDLDYSKMGLYSSSWTNGQYQPAQKLAFKGLEKRDLCTPYVSADGEYLLFATVGESLDLYISESTGINQWSDPVKLPATINQNGQGNPYLTPDMKYLFFASDDAKFWNVNWVSTESFIKAKYDQG